MDKDNALLHPDPVNAKALMEVALGRKKAHLAVVNATLANVYTGELLEDQAVCVWDRWIAYVGPHPEPCVGPDTHIVDARGRTVIPGLIDGHMHMAWLYNPSEFLKYVIAGGTTTIVTEALETYAVCGCDGVTDFLASLQDQPIKIFATAPPMISISSRLNGIAITDLEQLLERPDIVGLGESYWQAVLQNPDLMLPIMRTALRYGKPLEGHSAGASGNKLNAYVTTGVSSCHEPIKAGEVLERLRLGLYVMVREGSIRRDLEEIADIKDAGVDLRRLILVTDGITPDELVDRGYMEYLVQKAIDCGFEPITALQMATLNVAEHFRLDHAVGGIAPGKLADLAIIPQIETIKAELVISSGRIIAEHGKVVIHPRPHRFHAKSLDAIGLPKPLQGSDFRIQAGPHGPSAQVRVVEMVTDLVTRERLTEMPVVDGQIRADLSKDIIKVAAIDRTHAPGKRFVALIHGFGMTAGALASSAGWDSSDIMVVGASEDDMAAAVNRLHQLKGGAVVSNGGKIEAELPLPVFGLLSQEPMETLIEQLKTLNGAVQRLGVTFRDPLLSLNALSGAAIPFLRICDEGLVDFKLGQRVELISTQ
jgi:adenine deaminase